jgi:hypothetical protein
VSKGPKLSPAETARQWLLDANRRQTNDELLIKPPLPLGQLNGQTLPHSEIVQAVTNWLRVTAATGAPSDVQRLWDKWCPFFPALRHTVRAVFDELLAASWARYVEACAVVEAADAAAAGRRELVQRAERERAAIKAERAKLDKREAAINELEARP